MATTGRASEDVWHVESVVKKLTTQRKIAKMGLNTQTVKKIPQLSQDLMTYTKERGKILKVKYNWNMIFLKLGG